MLYEPATLDPTLTLGGSEDTMLLFALVTVVKLFVIVELAVIVPVIGLVNELEPVVEVELLKLIKEEFIE